MAIRAPLRTDGLPRPSPEEIDSAIAKVRKRQIVSAYGDLISGTKGPVPWMNLYAFAVAAQLLATRNMKEATIVNIARVINVMNADQLVLLGLDPGGLDRDQTYDRVDRLFNAFCSAVQAEEDRTGLGSANSSHIWRTFWNKSSYAQDEQKRRHRRHGHSHLGQSTVQGRSDRSRRIEHSR